jgi:hypothetical protein
MEHHAADPHAPLRVHVRTEAKLLEDVEGLQRFLDRVVPVIEIERRLVEAFRADEDVAQADLFQRRDGLDRAR